MKTTYKMENLDCASCAAKKEQAVCKLPEIQNAQVQFITQKIVVETEENPTPELLKKIQKACRRIDADCKVTQ